MIVERFVEQRPGIQSHFRPWLLLGVAFVFLAPLTVIGGKQQSLVGSSKSAAMIEEAVEYNNRGLELSGQGEWEAALSAFQTAVSIYPGLAEAQYNLARTYHHLHQLPKAERAYRAALRAEPRLALAYDGLGNVYQSQGDSTAAISAYRRAVNLEPALLKTRISLSAAYATSGQERLAIEMLEATVALAPEEPLVHYTLGLVYLQQQEDVLARQALEKVLVLEPAGALAVQAREHLANLS